MNQIRRAKLIDTSVNLNECLIKLEQVKDEEEESKDNIPDNLQAGDAYKQSEECCDILEEIIDNINAAIDEIKKIT